MARVERAGLQLLHGALLAAMATVAASASRPNVLMVVIDDLRPNLGAYNNRTYMHTPNLDHLASRSMVFERAFTNYAYCAPSRNSFMSGRMPDTTKVWNFLNSFRDGSITDSAGLTGLQWTTLPQHFKKNGYWTVVGVEWRVLGSGGQWWV